MELIDKDALVAEIERRKHKLLDHIICERDKEWVVRTVHQLNRIIMFIDTLEVREVDLDKHLKEDIEDVLFDLDGVAVKGATHYLTVEDVKDIAKRFFELGLKVKQESNDDVKIGEAQIYLEDDGGEPPYDGKQWLDLSCTKYEIPKALFKDGDNVEILIRKAQKGE